MDRNVLRHNWHELTTELKERWPDLTDRDIQYIEGDEQKLHEVVMRLRHLTKEEAERDVRFFVNTLPPRRKLA